MSWSSFAGTEVDQGWREVHLLCCLCTFGVRLLFFSFFLSLLCSSGLGWVETKP